MPGARVNGLAISRVDETRGRGHQDGMGSEDTRSAMRAHHCTPSHHRSQFRCSSITWLSSLSFLVQSFIEPLHPLPAGLLVVYPFPVTLYHVIHFESTQVTLYGSVHTPTIYLLSKPVLPNCHFRPTNSTKCIQSCSHLRPLAWPALPPLSPSPVKTPGVLCSLLT